MSLALAASPAKMTTWASLTFEQSGASMRWIFFLNSDAACAASRNPRSTPRRVAFDTASSAATTAMVKALIPCAPKAAGGKLGARIAAAPPKQRRTSSRRYCPMFQRVMYGRQCKPRAEWTSKATTKHDSGTQTAKLVGATTHRTRNDDAPDHCFVPACHRCSSCCIGHGWCMRSK